MSSEKKKPKGKNNNHRPSQGQQHHHHQETSSPFDSPTRFAGSAVKGFNPGGSLYTVPSYSPATPPPAATPATKPVTIKKRTEGSLSNAASCPAAVPPPPQPQAQSAHSISQSPQLPPSLSMRPMFDEQERRAKSQQLLSAIKGNSKDDLPLMSREVVNKEKSVELMKLLNIKPGK